MIPLEHLMLWRDSVGPDVSHNIPATQADLDGLRAVINRLVDVINSIVEGAESEHADLDALRRFVHERLS